MKPFTSHKPQAASCAPPAENARRTKVLPRRSRGEVASSSKMRGRRGHVPNNLESNPLLPPATKDGEPEATPLYLLSSATKGGEPADDSLYLLPQRRRSEMRGRCSRSDEGANGAEGVAGRTDLVAVSISLIVGSI